MASVLWAHVPVAFAQEDVEQFDPVESLIVDPSSESSLESELATAEADATVAARLEKERLEAERKKNEDVTQPEQPEQKDEIKLLFEERPIKSVNFSNFFAYAVQHAVDVGVPANTIFVILVLPLLAMLIAFVRHVIGLPTLGLYVPIALSITLVSTGVAAGMILLASILLAATLAKFLLKRLKIMQLPKVALSMFVVALCIFATLTFSAQYGLLVVRQLSIFPILLLILLSERVVELQLERTLKETFLITLITCLLAIAGYGILTNPLIQNMVLLYPELVLLLIPANILIGRYFGLRLTEYYRFKPLRHAGK
jgi:hypothetical protein